MSEVEREDVHLFFVAGRTNLSRRAPAEDAAVKLGQVGELLHRHLHVDEAQHTILVRNREVVLDFHVGHNELPPLPGVVPHK